MDFVSFVVQFPYLACLWVKARRYREKKQKHKTRKFTVATSAVQVFTCSANRPPASVDYSESLRGYYFYFVQNFTSDKSQQDLFFYLGQVQKDLLKRSDYICTPPPAAFLLLFLPDQLEAPLLLGGEITQFKEKCIGSLQNGARTRIAKIVLFRSTWKLEVALSLRK